MKRVLSLIIAAIMIVSAVPHFSAGYTPAKVTGLKTKFSTVSTAKLSWTAVKNATGYKIFKYSSKTGEYTALAKTTGTAKTIKGLKSDTTYKFAVRAFRRVDGKVYFGKYSDKITVKTIALKDNDIKLLKKMLREFNPIVDYTDDSFKKGELGKRYNYSTSSYKEMLNCLDEWTGARSLWYMLFLQYGWSKYCKEIYDSDYDKNGNRYFKTPDPLNRMKDYGYYYYKVNGNKMDWIIKNVFNKTPSHNNKTIGSKPNNEEFHAWKGAYYYKGYYYLPFGDGGDYTPAYKIISKELGSSGIYTMKFRIQDENIEYTSPSYTIKAALKLVDGKRVWSIYKIY